MMNVEVRRRRGFHLVNAGRMYGNQDAYTSSQPVKTRYLSEEDEQWWSERTSPGAREPLDEWHFKPLGS